MKRWTVLPGLVRSGLACSPALANASQCDTRELHFFDLETGAGIYA